MAEYNFDPDKGSSSYDLADPDSIKGSPIKIYFYGDAKSDQRPNFYWASYELLFKRLFYDKMKKYLGGIHYLYKCDLTDTGERTGHGNVSIVDKETARTVSEKFKMSGEEAERLVDISGRKILEKLELVPHGLSEKEVSYNNTWEFATKKDMTWNEFKKEYNNDIYVMKENNKYLNPVKRLLNQPPEVKETPKEKELKMSQDQYHMMIVKAAKENYNHPEPEKWTGGFDILQQWEKDQVKKQHKKDK